MRDDVRCAILLPYCHSVDVLSFWMCTQTIQMRELLDTSFFVFCSVFTTPTGTCNPIKHVRIKDVIEEFL